MAKTVNLDNADPEGYDEIHFVKGDYGYLVSHRHFGGGILTDRKGNLLAGGHIIARADIPTVIELLQAALESYD